MKVKLILQWMRLAKPSPGFPGSNHGESEPGYPIIVVNYNYLLGTGTPMDEQSFAETFMKLVQDFGLLAKDKTPCGKDMSISEAFTLTLLSRDEPLTQKELSTRLRLEKSTVSRLIDGLERKEWVERRVCHRDRRRKHLHLTQRGNERARKVNQARRDRFKRILENIPEQNRGAVRDAFELFIDALHSAQEDSFEGIEDS